MLDYTELRWFIDDIKDKDIDQEIKAEWIKNAILDYLWPIFDSKYVIPYNIAPKGKIVIAYNTIKFSENRRNIFNRHDILIDGKNIIINHPEDYTGIDNLKETIKKMKDMIC